MSDFLRVEKVVKDFPSGETTLRVLKGVTLSVEAGKITAIVGPSGAGKSTLLHIMGFLDRPTSGDVVYRGRRLSERLHHLPSQLSGGERQRVAIARALVGDPEIVFCDEPTGNLDAATSAEIQKLILELSHETEKTFVVVTHDPDVARLADRRLRLVDGRFVDGG